MIKLCFFSISLLFLPGLLVAQGNYVANTASGSSAAPYNTLVGVQAGTNINSSGLANVFTGYQAGYSTTSGINNVFVGLGTGYNSTVGIQNVAVGHQAGVGSGSNNNNNVSIGFQAGVGSGTVSDAVNIGYMAGHNSTGTFNVFIGSGSGQANISGGANSFLGYRAGYANTTGGANSFLGYRAGYANTTGEFNSFLGYVAGAFNTTGGSNSFMGAFAGNSNTIGINNSFVGAHAGFNNTTGINNSFLGNQAGSNVTTGNNNIIIGPNSGTAITTSDDNVLMGYNSQADEGIFNGIFNGIAIGSGSRVASSNSLILGNGVKVGIGTSAPKNKLEVVADETDNSGLRLAKLTSQSKPSQATDQFLTVNEKGDVVKARYQLRINTANEWSDQVFLPTYQLRPLATVASYIAQHGHLPNIPSAEEVVKEGVDLVKMNATLLEKVEELTLYSIQLEQELQLTKQKQQSEIDELKRLLKLVLEKK